MSSAFFLTWPCALHFPRPAPVCHLLCVQSAKAGQKLTVFAVPWFLYALPWNINRIINCSWEPSYPATVFTHSRKENSRCVANNAFSHTPISSCNNCHVLCYMYILEGGWVWLYYYFILFILLLYILLASAILSSTSLFFFFLIHNISVLFPFLLLLHFFLLPSPHHSRKLTFLEMSVGRTLCPVSPARVQLALAHQNTSGHSSGNPGMFRQQAWCFGGRCLLCSNSLGK